jgi:hypothetical protein
MRQKNPIAMLSATECRVVRIVPAGCGRTELTEIKAGCPPDTDKAAVAIGSVDLTAPAPEVDMIIRANRLILMMACVPSFAMSASAGS